MSIPGDPLERLQEREFDRKQFLEKLQQSLFSLEQDLGQYQVCADLSIAIILYLRKEQNVEVLRPDEASASGSVQDFFANTILRQVYEWSPVGEERNAIFSLLLEYTTETLTGLFKSALLHLTQSKREEFLKIVGK